MQMPHAWDRYACDDGDGRRVAFQIRPSAKQVMRKALKRDSAERRAATLWVHLFEKAKANAIPPRAASVLSTAPLVDRPASPK